MTDLQKAITKLEADLADSRGDLSAFCNMAVDVARKRKPPSNGSAAKLLMPDKKALLGELKYVPLEELPEDHIISEEPTVERPQGLTVREEEQRLQIAFSLASAILQDSSPADTVLISRPDLVKKFGSAALKAKAEGSHFLRAEEGNENKPALRLVRYNGLL